MSEKKIIRPLTVASSGGHGHIVAAKGIIDQYMRQDNVEFVQYQAVQYEDRQTSVLRLFLTIFLYVKSFQYVAYLWEEFHKLTGISNILDHHSFWEEIKILRAGPKQRLYVDILLDYYPFGYEMAAIFNGLQRKDRTKDLHLAVNKQILNDKIHYYSIYHQFKTCLKKQAKTGKPYTSIISTQPQSLQAMIDAVIWYNEEFLPSQVQKVNHIQTRIGTLKKQIASIEKWNATYAKYPIFWPFVFAYSSIMSFFVKQELRTLYKQRMIERNILKEMVPLSVDLYMTDLPTEGATHFVDVLKRLKEKQRRHLQVYCVGESPVLSKMKGLTVRQLSSDNNPMLRQAFHQKEWLKTFTELDKNILLSFSDHPHSLDRVIPANEKVASIMLGSIGGNASVEYIKPLLTHGYKHIFIFGAKRSDYIMQYIAQLPLEQQACIIPLDNQGDESIASIMTRSQCVVTRSGGLSTMEQMALPIIKNKLLLIHHKNPMKGQSLTAGLSWEDGNADRLIKHYETQGEKAIKTCPNRVWSDLQTLNPIQNIGVSMFKHPKIKLKMIENCTPNRALSLNTV